MTRRERVFAGVVKDERWESMALAGITWHMGLRKLGSQQDAPLKDHAHVLAGGPGSRGPGG